MQKQKIILGISGGIAAYKTPELVRRLKSRGAEVQVVVTRSAIEFVTETTLQAVSGLPVRSNLWDTDAEAAMGHIELARWADLVLIAPATAEIMARLAAGSGADLLTTLCLATEAPIAIAPAMNHVMWSNAAVQENRQRLESRGVQILGPASGDQACGESGLGRMLEPDDIVAAVLASKGVPEIAAKPLSGKTVMITAGPTREAIDSVRYISNRSSGKMGYALATAARDAGAKVMLVSGPVVVPLPENVVRFDTESAADMYSVVHQHLESVDIFIGAAAVSDYHVAGVAVGKIKKTAKELSLDLERTKDVLASVARLPDRPFTVGFAAETENLREYALEKLERKNLHMIVANLVGKNLGFETDRNAVKVFWRGGEASFPIAVKDKLAEDLIALIGTQYLKSISADTRIELPPIAIRD
jgi:phosphopantothenoylcysteine decarboxylase/phosphopantothenate--cysteine ligase